MEKNKDCAVYEDLMSLYADKLTQPETNRRIEEHLSTCDACRTKYDAITQPLEVNREPEGEPSIDHLKKIRRRQRGKIILIIFALLSAMVLGALAKLFLLGSPVEITNLQYQKDLQEQGELHIRGEMTGSAEVLTRYKVKDMGDHYEVTIYAGLPSVFHRNSRIDLGVPFDKPIMVNGDLIQTDGFVIRKFARDLYETRHPYIGDVSRNLDTLNILGIHRIAPYTLELQTDKKPYEMIIRTELTGDSDPVSKDLMAKTAVVILSLIDNCEIVTWDMGERSEQSLRMDMEAATALLGQSPKAYVKDLQSFQKLLNQLGIFQ